jgi:hypothetical protein
MVQIVFAILISFLIIVTFPIWGLIFGVSLAVLFEAINFSLIFKFAGLGFLVIGFLAFKNSSINQPYKKLITEIDKLIAENDVLLAATKLELKTFYKPITDYTLLSNITDIILLNNTKKYLVEVMAAQNKYNDFFSNTAVSFLETEMSQLVINEYGNQLQSKFKSLFLSKALASRTESSGDEGRLHLIQNRIKQLTM